MPLPPKKTPDLKATLAALEALKYRKTYRRFEFFKPYLKQQAFYAMGAFKRERMFRAGNQVGKSEGGAYEAALHATGLYPKDWEGKRFTHPTRGWAAGETSTVVRDVQQKKLLGPPGVPSLQGTGMIPKDCIIDTSLARGVTDALDTVQVAWHDADGVHKPGDISTITFKSFEQGRPKFQGDTIDWGWGDEECKLDIYEEFLARLTGDGILFITFTPLLGRTPLVLRFEKGGPDIGMVQMTLSEALHFTPEQRAKRLAGYSAHQRDAREKGTPLLGSGAVFNIPEEMLYEDRMNPHEIPSTWTKLWGTDFGIGHPFAAVLILWDKDADCIHVHHAIRMQDDGKLSLPIHHAAAMKPIGGNVPVAWPKDGTQRDKGSGEQLATLYRKEGLQMLSDPAMWEDGGDSTEAGILEMEQRMVTNRFKVARTLLDWFEEFREYHRKDGLIVKERDDLMSATRIAVMAKRFSRQVVLGMSSARKTRSYIAEGGDEDPF